MNFLFLFGLVFLSGCLHRNDKKDKESKASKVEINNSEGGALVSPSQDLKALRLQVSNFENSKVSYSLSQKTSKKSIQAHLTDIPVVLGAVSFNQSFDNNNNRHITYVSSNSYDDVLSFYKNDLVQFGWRVVLFYSDADSSLIFAKKPHKYAVLSLKKNKSFWKNATSVFVDITISYI